jgi:ubiquinone/menaquinone biosynthesis C-methylase UbiE
VVFDNACGTGIVSSILQQELDEQVKNNMKLTCGDISSGMLDYVKHRIGEENWQNVEVKVVDAQDSGLLSSHFTHVIASFGEKYSISFIEITSPSLTANSSLCMTSVHGTSQVIGCP